MRFILPAIALLFLGFLGFSHADLRYASTPKNNFAVRNRANSVAFTTKLALYMEPSTFGYQGLANQRANNYDNFLRSNIDNEQDNRNFNTEQGKDHLPFRTLEAKATDSTNQLPAPLSVEPGKEYVLPLRWNNPHASELELNIWINQNTIVVPIKKPVCAGEGYQDGVVSFTVPTDFNDLGAKVQGFQGCTKVGDCVLQMYAHSVEPRTYAAGTPIIIAGWDPAKATATNNNAVQPATADPGTDISKQPRDTCLPSSDPTSNIASAVPRYARQVSDVFNHAYQNSDYSPYSGQQQESISKNLAAAGILRMVNGNRGELGASILTQDQKNVLAKLRNTANTIVQNYEKITNKIINQVLKNGAKSTGTVAGQTLNNCFRCLETNSVSANRLQTTTYVPSFQITNAAQLAQAKQIVAQADAKYANLINQNGVVQIYVQALADMAPAYEQLQTKYKLTYQPAVTKPTAATMADATGFRKVDANGNKDGGKYAATKAKATLAARAAAAKTGTNAKDVDISTLDINEPAETYTFSGFTDSGVSILSGIDIETFSGAEIAPLSIEGSDLAPNADDDPSQQSGYDDREDKVEALPIGQTDAQLQQDSPAASSGCSSSVSCVGTLETAIVPCVKLLVGPVTCLLFPFLFFPFRPIMSTSTSSSAVAVATKKSAGSNSIFLGGAASMVAACTTHPLDLLKVRLQTQVASGGSFISTVTGIIRNEGILALYNGLSASLLRQATYSTARFGGYEWLKDRSLASSHSTDLPLHEKVSFSLISGAFGGVVGNPADVVNVRMQADGKLPPAERRNYAHAIDGLIRITKENGVTALWRGVGPNVARGMLMTAGQLASYDQFKGIMLRSGRFRDGTSTHFIASTAAGVVATIMTAPVDVVKTRVMNARKSEQLGTLECFGRILKHEGALGFYKGFVPAFVRLGPHTIVTFMTLEKLKKWLA